MADQKNNTGDDLSVNRIPVADKMKKVIDGMRMFTRKASGRGTDVEVNEVMDGGTVVARVVKKDDKVLEQNVTSDIQTAGKSDEVLKAAGVKKDETNRTTPTESAEEMTDAKQTAPERPKDKETFESETKEKIKAPDSKEKKTKEPKDAKKPDNSMSKMASGESAETQGAAPLEKSGELEKNYIVKRVGDTLQYTRLGQDKKKPAASPVGAPGPQSNAAVVPPHATQTPNQVATKAPSTGPDQPRGTAASPQQPPAPAPATGKIAPAAPTAKQPPSTKWKEMFNARKTGRDMSKIAGGKGYVTSKGTVMVKSDELKKDVVEFKKPTKAASDKKPEPAKSGHQGMFETVKNGRSQAKPGTRDEKIKAALAAQASAGSPYAETRGGTSVGARTKGGDPTKQRGQLDVKHQEAVKKQRGIVESASATPATTVAEVKKDAAPKQAKPLLVRDMNRLKVHTQSGRPFRVMMATHEDHANLPGYHMGLDKDHSVAQVSKHLSNPIHPITKAVYAALERGHDKLIVHNPNQPFKAVK